MPQFPGFIGDSNPTQSVLSGFEQTINMLVEKNSPTDVGALLPSPGFQALTTVAGDVGTRALIYANGRAFALIGLHLWEFLSDWTPVQRGSVAVDANPGQMAYNGIGGQIGIASGGSVYCFTLATNVLSAALLTGGYTHLVYAAGFGLAFNINTGRTLLSNPEDMSVWNAGTFFARSLFADPAQAIFVDANNLVWILGQDTFEVRYNSGTGTQPFVPLTISMMLELPMQE